MASDECHSRRLVTRLSSGLPARNRALAHIMPLCYRAPFRIVGVLLCWGHMNKQWIHLFIVILCYAAAVGMACGGRSVHRPDNLSNPTPDSVAAFDRLSGGVWERGENLLDHEGRYQARQEHMVVELNGFVYISNGFVPIAPPPEATLENPEPDTFEPTDGMMAYVPAGHPAVDDAEGQWVRLNSRFPEPHHHHVIFAAHRGRIWAFGGHDEKFHPTDHVYVFTPQNENAPEGNWHAVDDEGAFCDPLERDCLRLPRPLAAGFAVSFGDRIYILGGVEWDDTPADPVNAPIVATANVWVLDTAARPFDWVEAPPMHTPREHFTAVVVGGRIYALQGRNQWSPRLQAVESWAPGEVEWRPEPDAPIGASANIVGAVGSCIYAFGGEFIATTHTGTLSVSQVFHVPTNTWRILEPAFREEPYDASLADRLHGVFGAVITETGEQKIIAPGGGERAWLAPISRVHFFTPPEQCF
jgi:hypothetical protein